MVVEEGGVLQDLRLLDGMEFSQIRRERVIIPLCDEGENKCARVDVCLISGPDDTVTPRARAPHDEGSRLGDKQPR